MGNEPIIHKALYQSKRSDEETKELGKRTAKCEAIVASVEVAAQWIKVTCDKCKGYE